MQHHIQLVFYIKKKFHNKIGLYDLSFKCSADYDFYLRLFKNKNILIKSTQKIKLLVKCKVEDFPSKLSPLQHLNEETRIRNKNNENIILIFIIYLNTLVKIFLKN